MRKYAPPIKKSDNFQTTRRKELILHIHIVFYTLRMCGPNHTYLGPETGEQDHVRVRRGSSDSEMLFFLFFPGKKPPSLMIPNQSDLVMTVGGRYGAGP